MEASKTCFTIEEKVAILNHYFPGVVTELIDTQGNTIRKVNTQLLQQALGVEQDCHQEFYGFSWYGKKAAMMQCDTPPISMLEPIIHQSKDWDTTGNLYIEGDNLEALKLLQQEYRNQIRMIYIDPPYNTGNDFIYKDNYSMCRDDFQQLTDTDKDALYSRIHSGWCNMIYPRIKLAHTLLSEDGVMFISIDDNELDNLKKICNEIFGETNFITIIGLEITKTQGMKVKSAKEGSIVKNYEYILCYAKKAATKKIVRNLLYDKNEGYDPHFFYYIENDSNGFTVQKLTDVLMANQELLDEFKKYSLTSEKGKINIRMLEMAISLSGKVRDYIYKTNAHKIYQEMACSISIDEDIQRRLQHEKIIAYKGYLLTQSSGGKLRQFSALSETLQYNDEYKSEYGRVTIRGNLWKGFYSDMMNVAKEGEVEYKNGKKPVRLILQLAKWIGVQDDEIVLDFFSGSATTAHAVMLLNAVDGGKRRFIMVQMDEDLDLSLKNATGPNVKTIQKTIAFLDSVNRPHILSELGKERILRSGQKIMEHLEKQQRSSDPISIDTGFRVYRLNKARDNNANPPQHGEW